MADALAPYRRLTVKIGSATIVDSASGRVRTEWLAALAEDLAGLKSRGVSLVVVSSGAIALGRGILGLTGANLTLEQALIASGDLSAGHARALIGVPDPSAAAKRIVAEGLNVRQTEALAHEEGVPERKSMKPRTTAASPKDTDTLALEKRVSDMLGLKVSVTHRDPDGTVQIRYGDLDQLDEIMRRLGA